MYYNLKKPEQKYGIWKKWYAWFPVTVTCTCGEHKVLVWLEDIWRKEERFDSYGNSVIVDVYYSLVDPEPKPEPAIDQIMREMLNTWGDAAVKELEELSGVPDAQKGFIIEYKKYGGKKAALRSMDKGNGLSPTGKRVQQRKKKRSHK